MSESVRVLGDRYEVGDLLGRGGMADVHAGLDRRLDRRVAIKLLRSDVARDPVFQARFRREAQSSALLNHPAVVTVHDTGEDVSTGWAGAEVRTPYIVMEHVPGRTVRDLLQEAHAAGETGLGVQRAVEITAGVLTALQAAHDAGIVHRDVKPANVMVTPTGGIKVMDFGIARAVADSSATMTQTSAVIGTAQYLSPEQARGEVVDARTDLYSTGCLLYELLTGRPPFTGESALAVVYQHVGELPAPPSRHNPAVSTELERVVLTALSKQRDDRHSDADEFREDLLAAEAGYPVAVSTAPRAAAAAASATPAAALAAVGRSLPTTTEVPRVVTDGADGAGPQPGRPGRRRSGRRAGALVVAALAAALALTGWLPGRGAQEATGLVTVQDVVGAQLQAATTTLTGQGLVVSGDVLTRASSASAGSVLVTDPPAGDRVEPRTPVVLTVSSGPAAALTSEVTGGSPDATAHAVVADYTGQPSDSAARALEGLGLRAVTAAVTSDRPAGQVVHQSEAAGTSLALGSTVTLYASSGPATAATAASASTATSSTAAPAGVASPTAGRTTAPPAVDQGTGQRATGQQSTGGGVQASAAGGGRQPSPAQSPSPVQGAGQPGTPGRTADAGSSSPGTSGQGKAQGANAGQGQQGQGQGKGQGKGQQGQGANQGQGQGHGQGRGQGG